jgi:hypothetical protein
VPTIKKPQYLENSMILEMAVLHFAGHFTRRNYCTIYKMLLSWKNKTETILPVLNREMFAKSVARGRLGSLVGLECKCG